MPKKNRVAIYEYLFKEGVMVAKKDYHAPKHPELENLPNLQVIKAMQVIHHEITPNSKNLLLKRIIKTSPIFFKQNDFLSNLILIVFTIPVTQIARLRQRAICLETLLLVSDERGNRVFASLLTSAARNCTSYT